MYGLGFRVEGLGFRVLKANGLRQSLGGSHSACHRASLDDGAWKP